MNFRKVFPLLLITLPKLTGSQNDQANSTLTSSISTTPTSTSLQSTTTSIAQTTMTIDPFAQYLIDRYCDGIFFLPNATDPYGQQLYTFWKSGSCQTKIVNQIAANVMTNWAVEYI